MYVFARLLNYIGNERLMNYKCRLVIKSTTPKYYHTYTKVSDTAKSTKSGIFLILVQIKIVLGKLDIIKEQSYLSDKFMSLKLLKVFLNKCKLYWQSTKLIWSFDNVYTIFVSLFCSSSSTSTSGSSGGNPKGVWSPATTGLCFVAFISYTNDILY